VSKETNAELRKDFMTTGAMLLTIMLAAWRVTTFM